MKLPKISKEFLCAVLLVVTIWLVFTVVIRIQTLRTTIKITSDSMLRAKAPHLIYKRPTTNDSPRSSSGGASQRQAEISPSTTLGTTSDVAGWKTYRNEKFGIQFQYPSNFTVNPFPPDTDTSDVSPKVILITNGYLMPSEGEGRDRNLTLQMFLGYEGENFNTGAGTLEDFAAKMKGLIKNINLGPNSYKLIDFGSQSSYFIQKPHSTHWLEFYHSCSVGVYPGDKSYIAEHPAGFLNCEEQKAIVNQILSTFKFTN